MWFENFAKVAGRKMMPLCCCAHTNWNSILLIYGIAMMSLGVCSISSGKILCTWNTLLDTVHGCCVAPPTQNKMYAMQQVINFHLNENGKIVRQQQTKTEKTETGVSPSLPRGWGSGSTCRTIQNWRGKKKHSEKKDNKLIFFSSGFLIAANERL